MSPRAVIILTLRIGSVALVCWLLFDLIEALSESEPSSILSSGSDGEKALFEQFQHQVVAKLLLRIGMSIVLYLIAPLLATLATVGTKRD
jgi:hypothetical protein